RSESRPIEEQEHCEAQRNSTHEPELKGPEDVLGTSPEQHHQNTEQRCDPGVCPNPEQDAPAQVRDGEMREHGECKERQVAAEAEPVAHALERDSGDQVPVADMGQHDRTVEMRRKDRPVIAEEPLAPAYPQNYEEAQEKTHVMENGRTAQTANGHHSRHPGLA